jgi:hypothetical protein
MPEGCTWARDGGGRRGRECHGRVGKVFSNDTKGFSIDNGRIVCSVMLARHEEEIEVDIWLSIASRIARRTFPVGRIS